MVFIDEGVVLYLVFNELFECIFVSIVCYIGGLVCEVLMLGVVGIFVIGWLLLRLVVFEVVYLDIELCL